MMILYMLIIYVMIVFGTSDCKVSENVWNGHLICLFYPLYCTITVLFVINHENYRSTKSQILCADQCLSKCVNQSQWQNATQWPGRFQERWVYSNHIKLLLERVCFCWSLTLESCRKPKSQILPIFILVFPKVCAPAPVVAHPHHHHAHHTKAVHGK